MRLLFSFYVYFVIWSYLLVSCLTDTPLNYKCKNACEDWPLPCRLPSDGWKYRGSEFPILAWWPPSTTEQVLKYAAANFTAIMIGDRLGNGTFDETWVKIKSDIAYAVNLGLEVWMDTYSPGFRSWGNVWKGYSAWPGYGYYEKTKLHKITTDELQWMAKAVQGMQSVTSLLITDDGVDLSLETIEKVQWMRENTPNLVAWVNQCGDGSEWLSRVGVAQAVPEIYEIKTEDKHHTPTHKTAIEMAQSQLRYIDMWLADTIRFNLEFWPIFNVGDGGDTGYVRSSSFVRFQVYASIAYNAKGLIWYCWGRGLWNLTTEEPTTIYPYVKEPNSDVRAWSKILLNYTEHQGAYHTGWEGPSSTSLNPGSMQLILNMSDLLLAGIMSKKNDENSLLVMIVDKRLSNDLNSAPPRNVTILFSSDVKDVQVIPGWINEHYQLKHSENHETIEMQLTLKMGGGKLLKLIGNKIASKANSFRTWRYSSILPDMNHIRSNQWKFYNYNFKSLHQASFVIGATDVASQVDLQQAEKLARTGFNTFLAVAHSDQERFAVSLNSALKWGLFTIAAPQNNTSFSKSDVEKLHSMYSCHPNLAGYLIGVNLEDVMPDIFEIGNYLRYNAQNLFALSSSSSVDIIKLLGNTNLPTNMLNIGQDIALDATTIYYSLISAAAESPTPFSVWVNIDLKNKNESLVRFQTYSALAYGINGLWFKNVILSDFLAYTLQHVIYWGNQIIRNDIKLSQIFYTGSTVSGGIAPGPNELIVSMDVDLLVSVLVHTDNKHPPLLMIIDKSLRKERTVSIVMDSRVIAYGTIETYEQDGIYDCCGVTSVYGRVVTVTLPPGDCVMVGLTMHSDSAAPPDFEETKTNSIE